MPEAEPTVQLLCAACLGWRLCDRPHHDTRVNTGAGTGFCYLSLAAPSQLLSGRIATKEPTSKPGDGGRKPGAASNGPGVDFGRSLTRREREVAGLVAEGL